MAVDTTHLDSPSDRPRDALAAILAMAQAVNSLRNSAPVVLTSVSGTNSISASATQVDSVQVGCRVVLQPAADNTAAPSLSINGGPAYNIQDGYGGPLGAKGLKAGRYYDLVFQGAVWKVVGYGDHPELIRGLLNSSPTVLTSVGGTANAITATSGAIVNVGHGTYVVLSPASDNTGAATLSVNGGGVYNIQDGYGGAVGAGGLRAGRFYELIFTLPGGVWKIVGYGDHPEKIRSLQNLSASILTDVGGTANAVSATSAAISSVIAGTRVVLVPTSDNTGATTLQINGGGSFSVQDGYGGAVGAGALRAGRYYEMVFSLPGNVWKIVAYGDHPEKIRAIQNLSPNVLTAVGGTASAISATASQVNSLQAGTRVVLVPAVDSVAPTTLQINGGGSYSVQEGYGGAIASGTLRAGRYYELVFSLPGNVWKIISYGDDHQYLRSLFAGIATVSGTANAIALAVDNYPQRGMLLYFVPTSSNTGAVTLNSTAPNGSTGPLSLLKGANAPLVAGDLVANVPVLAIYEGAPGNTWKLLTAAGSSVPGSNPIDTALATLNSLVTVTPFGTQTYAAGVMTQADNTIVVQGSGSSVSLGEGARHPDDPAGNLDMAPATRGAVILSEEANLVGKFTVTFDNRGANGSFDNELPAQFAARGPTTALGRIYLPTPGMNAATEFGQLAAATQPGQINGIRASSITAAQNGYFPVLQTTGHPHPLLASQRPGGGVLSTWSWPSPTLNLTVPFTVDVSARTISGSYLTTYGPFGGTKLKVGSVLRFGAGPNSGVDLVIESFPAADTVKIAAGPTLTAETAVSRQLVHLASAAENETLMPCPPSKRYVRSDRTGAGTPLMGLRLYDEYNAAIVALALELRVPVIRIDLMTFDFVSANGGDSLVWNESTRTMTGSAPGWDAGYTTTYPGKPNVQQFNHPNVALRAATYDLGFRKLTRLYLSGQLTRDTVIR